MLEVVWKPIMASGATLGQTPRIYPARHDPRVDALGNEWLKGWHYSITVQIYAGGWH